MESFFKAIAWVFIGGDMAWQTILFVVMCVCIVASICKGVIAIVRCARKAIKIINTPQISEADLYDANQRAEKWYSFYLQACRAHEASERDLETTKQLLSATEEELFELQQNYNELGEAYNALKDILLENGITPDGPYTFLSSAQGERPWAEKTTAKE